MTGHLGSRVSALLDGQLPADEERRCWEHVHACHACRDLVEGEGWVKARLAGLDAPAGSPGLPGALHRALRQSHPDRAPAPAAPLSPPLRRGRSTVLALGVAGVGAATLGVAILAGAPGGGTDDLRPPASRLADAGGARADTSAAPQPVRPGHRFVPLRPSAP